MAEIIHEHRGPVHTDDRGSGYGAWIVGAILVALALLLAWWLFMSSSSPIAPQSNTTIIEQPQQVQPQEAPNVNVVPPDTEGDVNVVPPSGNTTTQ